MRNLFLSFVLFFSLVVLAEFVKSETLPTPFTTQGDVFQFSDYGGYETSTGAFTTNVITAAVAGKIGIVAGVVFSSGASREFVDIYISTVEASALRTRARIYNVNASSEPLLGGLGAGFVRTGPIRFKNGLFWQSSSALFNMITVLFQSN